MSSSLNTVEPGRLSERLAPVDEAMRTAVNDGVFPSAVLLVSRNRKTVHHHAYGAANPETGQIATTATVYDLASLTKPLATTLAVLKLVAGGALALNSRLGDVLTAFAHTDKAGIRIENLLCHTSGLPDWRGYFRPLADLPLAGRASKLHAYLVREPLVNEIGTVCRYSDLGFMILHWLIEERSGQGLDRFVDRHFYRPLGISDLFFIPLDRPCPPFEYAATERCPWRKRTLSAEVHDENAYAAGGIAGQSGLFGTAAAVNRLLTALIETCNGRSGRQLLPPELLRQAFARRDDCQRALGFDCPDKTGSSSGNLFSPNSVGHLGFTGTSFWVDLERGITVILLTNRIHPTRANNAIKKFRPLLHDTVMSGLLGNC